MKRLSVAGPSNSKCVVAHSHLMSVSKDVGKASLKVMFPLLSSKVSNMRKSPEVLLLQFDLSSTMTSLVPW